MNLSDNPHWQALKYYRHQNSDHTKSKIKQIIEACNITLDFTYQNISETLLAELILLADSCDMRHKIDAMFSGQIVNASSKQPALHTALRIPFDNDTTAPIEFVKNIWACRKKMYHFAKLIREKQWYAKDEITDVVNIGIGGSDLGPKFCSEALSSWQDNSVRTHFISDADPLAFEMTVKELSPKNTLFVVSSKSFQTSETLYNFNKAKQWIAAHTTITHHFIAVTAHEQLPKSQGIDHILPIWTSIGGRFSITSAINFITLLTIGESAFSQFLSGAYAMDEHFKHASPTKNLPLLAALIGIWNNNFLDARQHLILTYGNQLDKLTPYIQQLDMESNGKSIDIFGRPINYATSPVVWGGPGNQAQHSYYQLISQGTHKIAIELISLKENNGELINSMCDNKYHVLTRGVGKTQHMAEKISGGLPLSHILINELSPFSLGVLVAFYEHKIFCQGVIWQINSFDQPGVESAKSLLLSNIQHQEGISIPL